MPQPKQISLCNGEGVEIEQVGNPGLAVTKIGVKDGKIQIANGRDGWKAQQPIEDNGGSVVLLQGLCWAIPGCVVINFLDYNFKAGADFDAQHSGFRPLSIVPVAQLGLFQERKK